MTHFSKKMLRMSLTLTLTFCILFQSLYFNPKKVEANPGAAQIANYILSIVSAIDMGTGGGVRGVATSLKDALAQKVADLMGTGIYEDSNGNYVFSGEATQQIYETLLGSDAYNAIVCSNFPISSNYQPPNVLSFPQFWSEVNDYKANLSSYLQFYGSNYNPGSGFTYYTTKIIDTSNVAFIVADVNNYNVSFYMYDKNGSRVNCNARNFKCTAYTSSGEFYNKSYYDSNTSLFAIPKNPSSGNDLNNATYNSVFSNVTNVQQVMYNFNFNAIFSRKSIILATNVNSGISKSSANTGVTVNNYYNQIPSIKTTVLENNDWNSIYNNYVQNIQNESNTYIENGEIDIDALREEMQKQGSIIYDAVEEGVENIIEYVSVTNEWLKKIYNLLSEINNKLEDGGGSGDIVSGSTVDLSNIESYLQSLNTSISAMQTQVNYIANNLPNNEQQLTQIYTILQNIYQSLQNIPAGGSPNNPNSDPYAPWYPKFFGIPDTDIIDTVNKIEIIEALLSGLVPLCYITGLGAVVNALSAEPVEPVFTIPVQFENTFYSVDEELEIDLTGFDDMRDVVTGGIILVFMLSLGYFTIILLKFLLDIMSKA